LRGAASPWFYSATNEAEWYRQVGGNMNVAMVCAGALGLLLFFLSFAVSMVRLRTGIGIGTDGSSTSLATRSVRAQGNAAEYIGAFMVLFVILGSRDPAAWVEWTMVTATVARYLHAAGMYLSPDLNNPQPLRFVGSALTYLTGLVLSGALLAEALTWGG
jgi:uncharacterized protein